MKNRNVCSVCTRAIHGRIAKLEGGKKIAHEKCANSILERISEAYEIHRKWEQSLPVKERKVLQVIRSNDGITMPEIKRQTGLPMHDISHVLRTFGKKIKRTPEACGSTVTFKYFYKGDDILKNAEAKIMEGI